MFGFDADGYRWAQRRDRNILYLVFIKGMLADEARFERGAVKKTLLAEAAWERQNCVSADRIITTSHYLKTQLQRRYQLLAKKITVIPEYIDLQRWRCQRTATRRPA